MVNILFLDSYVLRFTLPNILLKVSIGYGSSIMFGNLIFHLWKQNKATKGSNHSLETKEKTTQDQISFCKILNK